MTIDGTGTSATASSDDALVGEISPAMLDKIKSDGKLYGFVWMGLAFFAAREFEVWSWLKTAIGSALHLDPYGLDRVSDIVLMLGLLAALVVVPSTFQWRAIKDELKYRRRHGKWRWEPQA